MPRMAKRTKPRKPKVRTGHRPQTVVPYAAATPATTRPLSAALALLGPLLLVTATFLAFAPALEADFVTWDDDRNFLENPHYRGLSSSHLAWMFTTTKMGHYQPLSWVTLGLDYTLFGMDAQGYHRTNLLLHCATALALYFLCLRLLALARPAAAASAPLTARWSAALAAALFGLHPLRAESVAWVTERRDVLSGLFFVLALIAYLRSCTGRPPARLDRRWYLASIALLTLSLLSKAWAMTMPVILIIFDAYPLRRLGKFPRDWFGRASLHRWLQKIPFLVLGALAAVQAARAQAGQFETLKTLNQYGLVPRLGQAFYGLGFYLEKTLLPVGLGPIYEIPHGFTGLQAPNLVSAGVVLAVTVVLILLRTRFPPGLALWAYYIVAVSPVLGLAQSGPQLVKDSYSYLCCMFWGLLPAALLLRLWCPTGSARAPGGHPASPSPAGPEPRRTALPWIALLLAAAVLVALTTATRRQTAFWKDSETLWTRALQVQPDSYNANNNLAVLLRKQGRIHEAIACYHKAVAARPTEANAYYNLGNALKVLARRAAEDGDVTGSRNYYTEAVSNYRKAIELNPLHAAYHFNLANTLTNKLGRGSEALPHYQQALRLKDNPRAPASRVQRSTLHYCIAFELRKLGRLDQARRHLQACLRLDPDHPQAKKLKRRLESELDQGARITPDNR